jgi:hypothetical protein
VPGTDNIKVFCSKTSKRSGQPCKAAAIRGTVPPRCRHHLGTSIVKARENERKTVIAQRADAQTVPVPITAGNALQADIDRSNGFIKYYEGLLAQQEDHIIRTLLNAERMHSHKLTQTALAQKLDERRTVQKERDLDRIAEIIEATLWDCGVDPNEDRVRDIIAGHIRKIVPTPNEKVVDVEVVEDWELAYEEWADEHVGSGPVIDF